MYFLSGKKSFFFSVQFQLFFDFLEINIFQTSMKPSKREKKTFSSGRFFKPRISKQFIRAAAQEGERLVIRRSLVRIPSACRSVLEQDTEPQTAPDEHEFESCFGQKHLLNVSEKLL